MCESSLNGITYCFATRIVICLYDRRFVSVKVSKKIAARIRNKKKKVFIVYRSPRVEGQEKVRS